MLGDGCIPKFSASHNPHISVTRSIKDIEYSQWLVNELDGFITNRGIAEYSTEDVRTHNIYKSCSFRTICSPVFNELANRWYPEGKKHIPHDFILTPLKAAIWFADDGCVSNPDKYSLDMKLATHGFTIDEALTLKCQLETLTHEQYRIYIDKEHPTIRGFTQASRSFLKLIDSQFPPMDRKSNLWRANNNMLLNGKPNKPNCPRCESDVVYSYGSKNGSPKYKCMTCMRTFQVVYMRQMKKYT